MAKTQKPTGIISRQSSLPGVRVFEFGGAKVRIAGTHEAPLFCAADVCGVLGITDSAQACARLDPDEVEGVQHGIGKKPALFVTESGLYSLIIGSRKPEAKAFKKWITSEVLPAIRRQGYYSLLAEDRQEQTEWLLGQIFPNLPAKARPMFRELIASMLTLRREKPTGTPVWARPLARLIYHWAIQIDGEQPHRRGQNRARTSSTPDYSMLSEAGKDRLREVCAVGVAMTNLSVTWRDWKHKMQLNYENKPMQLELMVPMVFSRGEMHLPAKGQTRGKGPPLLLAKSDP